MLGVCFIVFMILAFAFFTFVYVKELKREEKIREENLKILSTPIIVDQNAIDKLMGTQYQVQNKNQKQTPNDQIFSVSGKNNKKDFN